MYRLVIPAGLFQQLNSHLDAAQPREEGAFLLIRVGRGNSGVRLLAHALLLPPQDGWESRGPDHLRPSGQWLSAVIGSAIETSSGFAFIHSHPGRTHPTTLSPLDRETSIEWSKSLTATVGRPFASLVWSTGTISGWAFEPADPTRPHDIERVDALGNGNVKALHQMIEPIGQSELDDRQVRSLQRLGNARLRQLSIGVVGTGGTGSAVAEQLARLGVSAITLVDPDRLDTPSNIRRVVGSRASDLDKGLGKAEVVGGHLKEIGLAEHVTILAQDVRTESAAKALLDTDMVISTTDTHSSRAFLNQIAYQYWLPLLDVGARVGLKKSGEVSGMPVEVRVLLPDNGCLWCRRVLSADRIREENLPANERARLAAEGYVQGLEGPQPSLASLNYFAASLIVLTAIRLYSGQPLISLSFILDPWEQYFQAGSGDINPDCICHDWRGLADELPIVYLPATRPATGR